MSRAYNGLTTMQETVLIELARKPGQWVEFEPRYLPTVRSLLRRGTVQCICRPESLRARLAL